MKRFVACLGGLLVILASCLSGGAGAWALLHMRWRLELVRDSFIYRYPKTFAPFKVWAPSGLDIREKWDGSPLPDKTRCYVRKPGLMECVIPRGVSFSTNQWRLCEIVFSTSDKQILETRYELPCFSQNERDARRLFHIYEHEIDRQLRFEPRPEMDCYNDGWNSILHQSWRIEPVDHFYWFRLDLDRYGNEWYLFLDIIQHPTSRSDV